MHVPFPTLAKGQFLMSTVSIPLALQSTIIMLAGIIGAGASVSAAPLVSCPGCAGQIVLGTSTAVPGVTMGIGYGNPSGDVGSPGTRPNGTCAKNELNICVIATPCHFFVRYSLSVAVGMDVRYLSQYWIPAPPPGHWSDWIIVTEHFTSVDNGTHDEDHGEIGCGDPVQKQHLSLGGAEQYFDLVCAECQST